MRRPRTNTRALQGLIHPDVGRLRLGMDLEMDLSDLPLDEPIPEELIPRSSNLHQMYFNRIVEMIRTEKLTLRQLYMRYERGNKTLCGSVQTIADHMQDWLEAGAADGFMLTFPTCQTGWRRSSARRAGAAAPRHRSARTIAGTTLRDHLGLARPAEPPRRRPRPRRGVRAAASSFAAARRRWGRTACGWRRPGLLFLLVFLLLPCLRLLSLSLQDAAGAFSLAAFRRAFNVGVYIRVLEQHLPDRRRRRRRSASSSATRSPTGCPGRPPHRQRCSPCWCSSRSGPARW